MNYTVEDDLVADKAELPPDCWEKVLYWHEKLKPLWESYDQTRID